MAPSPHIIRGSVVAVKPDEPREGKKRQPEPSKPRKRPGGKAELKGLIRMSDKYLGLSNRGRIVFDALLDFAGRFEPDGQGGEIMECHPRRETIARGVKRSIDFVDRGLAELRKAGLVVSVNRGGWSGKRNHYTIFVPREIIEQRRAEAEADPTPQTCGTDDRTSAGSNAAHLRHSLEPVPENHCVIEPPTTTTHAEQSRPAGTGGGGGGGRVCASDEQKTRAIAELKRRGIGALKPIRQELDAGRLTVEQIAAVLWHVDGQENELGAGFIVKLLLDPDELDLDLGEIVGEFRQHIEQERTRAERKRQAELDRAERERRDQAERGRQEQIAAQQQAERAALAVDRGRFEEQRKQANARELHAENLRRIIKATDDAIIGAFDRLVLSLDHPLELRNVLSKNMSAQKNAERIYDLAEQFAVVAFWVEAELRQELRRAKFQATGGIA